MSKFVAGCLKASLKPLFYYMAFSSRKTFAAYSSGQDDSLTTPLNRIIASPRRNTVTKAISLLGPALNEELLDAITACKNQEPKARTYLQLNVGGTSYRLSTDTILKRGETGLLYHFMSLTHKDKLRVCDDYLLDAREYFFERPAHSFEPIYAYYVTGVKCKPNHISQELFAAELVYWGIAEQYMDNKEDEGPKRIEDPFKGIYLSKFRKQVWNLFETPDSSMAARIMAITSIFAVLVSNLGLVFGTLEMFRVNTSVTSGNSTVVKEETHFAFEIIEFICIMFFSVEYFSKIIVTPNRIKVMLQFMNFIDLVAILPFYFELALVMLGFDSEQIDDFQGAILVVRILRILRVIRLLKLGRYSQGLQMFVRVMQKSGAQLGMVFAVVGIATMFFSTLVYFTEKDIHNTKFTSIPAAFWWCLVTITTVGYGDMYPHSTAGKFVSSCAIATGLLVLALPVTVIVDNFMQVQEEFKMKEARKCKDTSYQNISTMVQDMRPQ